MSDIKEKTTDTQSGQEDIQIDNSSFLQSKAFRNLLWIVGGLIVLLAVFKAGEIVGANEAIFAYQWNRNYSANFTGRFSPGVNLNANGFMLDHGAFGPIISINSPDLVVEDNSGGSGVEKNIITSTDTVIQDGNSTISFGDLQVNEPIVVIGSPNSSGQIDARLIRVLPMPPMSPISATSSSSTSSK